jgi:DNA-binding NarL/FixJ family response regulator
MSSSGAEVGLVLVDLSFNPVAFDQGAVSILNQSLSTTQTGIAIPEEILSALRRRSPSDLFAGRIAFHIGHREYSCCPHLLETLDGSTRPLIALHLERDSSVADVIYKIAEEYRLTEREREALSGISMGLSSKQVAERMHISPNTVKAFRRLIMIKMGVTSRAGVVAKLLEYNGYSHNPVRQSLAS